MTVSSTQRSGEGLCLFEPLQYALKCGRKARLWAYLCFHGRKPCAAANQTLCCTWHSWGSAAGPTKVQTLKPPPVPKPTVGQLRRANAEDPSKSKKAAMRAPLQRPDPSRERPRSRGEEMAVSDIAVVKPLFEGSKGSNQWHSWMVRPRPHDTENRATPAPVRLVKCVLHAPACGALCRQVSCIPGGQVCVGSAKQYLTLHFSTGAPGTGFLLLKVSCAELPEEVETADLSGQSIFRVEQADLPYFVNLR